jgi:hypothetical protein
VIDAKYTINHVGGTEAVTLNQKQNGGKWNLLGTYSLDTGSSVMLTDSSSDPSFDAVGYISDSVCADAIKFVYIGAACNPADTNCDNCVRQEELLSHISRWKSGQVALANLMEAISIWKKGC